MNTLGHRDEAKAEYAEWGFTKSNIGTELEDADDLTSCHKFDVLLVFMEHHSPSAHWIRLGLDTLQIYSDGRHVTSVVFT